MSLATLLDAPRPPARPRGRGRKPVADDPGQRALHIRCATFRLAHRLTVPQVAILLDCSERSVKYWTKLALGYDTPEADALRRLGRPADRGN